MRGRRLNYTAPPLEPRAGGGDACRLSRSRIAGTGLLGPSPGFRVTGGGDDCQRHVPSRHARPTGSATKRVASPDFTRISTVRLPSERASSSALRTSAGFATDLPATSRMTSPVLK